MKKEDKEKMKTIKGPAIIFGLGIERTLREI